MEVGTCLDVNIYLLNECYGVYCLNNNKTYDTQLTIIINLVLFILLFLLAIVKLCPGFSWITTFLVKVRLVLTFLVIKHKDSLCGT